LNILSNVITNSLFYSNLFLIFVAFEKRITPYVDQFQID
jgi:hypothetical protein